MKKKLYLFIFFISIASLGVNEAFAQVPQSFLYQAEARDSRGKILVEDELLVRVTIIQDITEVYRETHAVQTDLNGLFNLRIGEGEVTELGDFSTIEWDNGTYYLNIQIAIGTSTNYTDMGTTQLLSVPYALHAETVSNVNDADSDPTNELQDLEINNDILRITLNNDATEIDLSPYIDNSNLTEEEVDVMVDNNGYQLDINDGDVDAANELQSLSITDHELTISDGNTIPLPDNVDDADADPTNEIQDLSLIGNILTITKSELATEIDLSPYLDNSTLTEEQVDKMVSDNGYQMEINDGDVDALNEIQTLSIIDHELTISDANTIPLPDNVDDADADPTNELQSLSIIGSQLSISGGNSISLPIVANNGGISVYTSAEIAELDPNAGDAVFNSTEDLILIHNGNKWLPFIPETSCWPAPTKANAGYDQKITDNTTTVTLSANTPEAGYGYGRWSGVGSSGEPGSFADYTSPNTTFTGNECTTYTLRWTIITNCGVSIDDVIIEFDQIPTVSYAGEDIIVSNGSNTATLAANTPETGHGTGLWSIVSGSGGNFADPSSPNTTFTGTEGSYVLRWTIRTNCHVSYDDVAVSLSSPLVDVDGNSYKTVWIGNQLWMAENLKTQTLNDGTAIPLVSDNTEWSNLTTPGYCWYNNDEASYGNDYGALYNWYSVGTEKLCPMGWHVPIINSSINTDWWELYLYIGGFYSGGKLKEIGTFHWNSPNTGATNETGFTALPGGMRDGSGIFAYIGSQGNWWSKISAGTAAQSAILKYNSNTFQFSNTSIQRGYSVRCVKD